MSSIEFLEPDKTTQLTLPSKASLFKVSQRVRQKKDLINFPDPAEPKNVLSAVHRSQSGSWNSASLRARIFIKQNRKHI